MSDGLSMKIAAIAHAASQPAASTPPAAVAVATILGYSPSEWLVFLSILWVLIQISLAIYDRCCIKQGRRKDDPK